MDRLLNGHNRHRPRGPRGQAAEAQNDHKETQMDTNDFGHKTTTKRLKMTANIHKQPQRDTKEYKGMQTLTRKIHK